MKTKNTWEKADISSEQLLDDDLVKSVYLFPDKLSSRGTATSGNPIIGETHIRKETPNNRNSGKFR